VIAVIHDTENSVKLTFPSHHGLAPKVLAYSASMLSKELIAVLQEEYNNNDPQLPYYGLFVPQHCSDDGSWLNSDRTLRSYDLAFTVLITTLFSLLTSE
jgi:hypothetical protein